MDATYLRIKALISAARMEVSAASCELLGQPIVSESLDNADELLSAVQELLTGIEDEDDGPAELNFG